MFQASLELGEHQRERPQTQPETQRQVPGQQQGADGQEGMAEPVPVQHQQGHEKKEAQRWTQFPEWPRPRRPDPNSLAYGGWDVLDSLTVEQCAVRPPGLHTIDFILNSLHEEWTDAWNAVHMLRQTAISEEEKERTLKRILWLPQGILHAPQRGGNKGNRQHKELARRFVMWRQRYMLAIVKTWKMTAVSVEKRLSKPKARKAKGD